ncbi:MAG: glycerol-3-phosphate responsive antiterminator [Thermaerobacter sp.]|nr:glycerol-3-phosphate responsive antiterminator [Thermaerobacter sp.]
MPRINARMTVIPALRDPRQEAWLPRPARGRWVFVVRSALGEVSAQVARLQVLGWRVGLHVDTVRGLDGSTESLHFLACHARPDAVISTRPQLIRMAANMGFVTIERMFLIDGLAVKEGIIRVQQSGPTMVEVLPGTMPEIVAEVAVALTQPVIAGGLVTRPHDILALERAGALAASTSTPGLWHWGRVSVGGEDGTK